MITKIIKENRFIDISWLFIFINYINLLFFYYHYWLIYLSLLLLSINIIFLFLPCGIIGYFFD
jgi:hypothetical protein